MADAHVNGEELRLLDERIESKHTTLARKAMAEFMATTLFIVIGCGTIQSSVVLGAEGGAKLLAIAFAHGIAIAVLVSATAKISGGHINPVVSLAAWILNELSFVGLIAYVFAQCAGACLGALCLKGIYPSSVLDATHYGSHSLAPEFTVGNGVFLEILLTFVLVITILRTAVHRDGLGNTAPLAIGLAVFIDHLVGVPVSGASMNPARSLGPAILSWYWHEHWIYWVGPVCGSLLATVTYMAFFRKELPATF